MHYNTYRELQFLNRIAVETLTHLLDLRRSASEPSHDFSPKVTEAHFGQEGQPYRLELETQMRTSLVHMLPASGIVTVD